ncbi:MAG: HipA domain-containing protein, partial [Vitreimonas sp.]
LSLDVRLDGFDTPIGALRRSARGALSFAYAPSHLALSNARPLSLSMPLREKPFNDPATRAFFDNLLQERDGGLDQVLAREGLARDDIAGILYHIGKDCPGALSVLPEGAPPAKIPGDYRRDYRPYSPREIEAIAESLFERSALPENATDPSPLAGVRSKLALTLLPDGCLAEPSPGSGAPTTHILKSPSRRVRDEMRFEAAALDLSRTLGFETAKAQLVTIAGLDLLLITRFDRSLDEAGRIVRLHQEDFAQALGLSPALKYERRGTEGKRFDAHAIARVLRRTLNPARARETFVRALLFDLMIGNVDGHAKNYALLHGDEGAVLAPRYDLAPTRVDASLTEEFAFRIGNAETLEDLTAGDLDSFAAALGMRSAKSRERFLRAQTRALAAGLCSAFPELDQHRMKRFADLIGDNVIRLCGALNLAPPEATPTRDAFIHKGGGWRTS